MPYTTHWRAPKIFLSHAGVTIYCTYSDDDFDEGPNTYWFTTNNQESGLDDIHAFDVRELPNYTEPPHPPYLSGEGNTPENQAAWDYYHKHYVETKHNKRILREAIDLGHIKASND